MMVDPSRITHYVTKLIKRRPLVQSAAAMLPKPQLVYECVIKN